MGEFLVSSIVSERTKEGMVQVMWDGKACQLDVAGARELGNNLLHCAEAAESDAGIVHVITQVVKAPLELAYAVLIDLRKYREEQEVTRRETQQK